MFSLDDRAGNVVTTVVLFMAAGTILYLARGAFLILLLSLLFAYLLEPAVALVQRHSRLGQKNRTWAIAQVYLIGTLVLGSLGYKFGPRLAQQMKNLNAAVPEILEGLASGRTAASLVGWHGLSAAQEQQIQDLLARHHDLVARVFDAVRRAQRLSPRARSGFSPSPFWPSSSCEMDVRWRMRLSTPLNRTENELPSSESFNRLRRC